MPKGITTATNLMGVVGYGFPKVAKVQADVQIMFERIYDRYDIDAAYFLFNIAPDNLRTFVDFAKASGMLGFGVTMPHKTSMVNLVDDMTDYCKLTNAVNLVVIRDGKTFGYNTDGTGFCGKWDRDGVSMEGLNVVIIGAGSITATIAYELSDRGAASFRILNRTLDNAVQKAGLIQKITGKPTTAAQLTNSNLDEAAKKANVLVQAGSLGMMNFDGSITDFEYLGFIDHLPKDALVAEVVPFPLETTFLKKAMAAGHRTIDGADMICYQVPQTVRAYFGEEHNFDDDTILKISLDTFKGS